MNSLNFPSSGSMKHRSLSFKPDEKPNFLAQLQQNKKDLSWTKELVAEERTEDNSATPTLGGLSFFNGNEILRECGFDPRDIGENESWALLGATLLEQSCAELGHERKTAEHPNPLLTKHYFKKGRGKLDTHLEYAKTQVAELHEGPDEDFRQGLLALVIVWCAGTRDRRLRCQSGVSQLGRRARQDDRVEDLEPAAGQGTQRRPRDHLGVGTRN